MGIGKMIQHELEERYQTLRIKPLNPQLVAVIKEMEANPVLWVGSATDIHAVYHFLNGWQFAVGESEQYASFNEKMNILLSLRYRDFGSLNWASLLLRHEGEQTALKKFFELVRFMDEQ